MQISVEEMQETENPRDRESRFFEILSYFRIVSRHMESVQNERFTKDPQFGLKRALVVQRSKAYEKDPENRIGANNHLEKPLDPLP